MSPRGQYDRKANVPIKPPAEMLARHKEEIRQWKADEKARRNLPAVKAQLAELQATIDRLEGRGPAPEGQASIRCDRCHEGVPFGSDESPEQVLREHKRNGCAKRLLGRVS